MTAHVQSALRHRRSKTEKNDTQTEINNFKTLISETRQVDDVETRAALNRDIWSDTNTPPFLQ